MLKVNNKHSRKHTCRSVISVKLLCNFIEITLRYGYFLVSLFLTLNIFSLVNFEHVIAGWVASNQNHSLQI